MAKLMKTKLLQNRPSPKAKAALEVLKKAEEDLKVEGVEEEVKVDLLAEITQDLGAETLLVCLFCS